MRFPLNKNFILENNSETSFLKSYQFHTEIPQLPHPGAFGKERKNHNHEGVDLYCENNDEVYSMSKGKVIAIEAFTGVHANSPWWNDTWCVLVEHDNFVLNYGEIIPDKSLFIGKNLEEGDLVGVVKTVLKKNKGRPMSMLHLEMYEKGTKQPIKEWSLNEKQPNQLLNPTAILQAFITN
jgi:murein DD-endopeptidase MepM/ murein hydrolase activator NlpD